MDLEYGDYYENNNGTTGVRIVGSLQEDFMITPSERDFLAYHFDLFPMIDTNVYCLFASRVLTKVSLLGFSALSQLGTINNELVGISQSSPEFPDISIADPRFLLSLDIYLAKQVLLLKRLKENTIARYPGSPNHILQVEQSAIDMAVLLPKEYRHLSINEIRENQQIWDRVLPPSNYSILRYNDLFKPIQISPEHIAQCEVLGNIPYGKEDLFTMGWEEFQTATRNQWQNAYPNLDYNMIFSSLDWK